MPQQKSVAMELMERRIRELEKENDDLVNENLGMRENFTRINAIVSGFDDDDLEQEDDLSDEETDELLEDEDFEYDEDDEESDDESDEEFDEDEE